MQQHYFSLKKLLLFAALGILSVQALQAQDIITRWNFNGPAADQVPGGAESPLTQSGFGVAALAGGTTATFASGVASGGSSDPETSAPPNYGWNSSTYPALGAAPKTAGVEFHVSTANFENIIFSFDQRLSNTAANTWMVQYCLDVTATEPVWWDSELFTFVPQPTGTGDTWFNQRTVQLSTVFALNNNENAGFRIVSDFDPVTGNYLAARSTSSYGPAGTSRFDMVTVSGSLITSLTENKFDKVKFIHNGDQLQMQFNQQVTLRVRLLNASGALIAENAFTGSEMSLPIQQAKGLLLVQMIDNDGKTQTKKLIVQ